MIRRWIRGITHPQPALSDPGWESWFVTEAMDILKTESGRIDRARRRYRRRQARRTA